MRARDDILQKCEWMYFGDDAWVFGIKVRGVVRERVAEVYFDEGFKQDQQNYGWRRIVGNKRSVQNNLSNAVIWCEMELGILPKELT